MIADGFPVLNALRETHLILAEGAHNQFGDLPSAARVRDADHAVAAGPAGDARVPRRPRRWCRTRRRGWTGSTSMKTMQGWTDVSDHPLPRPRRLRRAAAAVDPLRQLERRQRPAAGGELGPLLAPGDPALRPRLPRGDRGRPDRAGRRDDAGARCCSGGSVASAPAPLRPGGRCATSPRRSTSACTTPARSCPAWRRAHHRAAGRAGRAARGGRRGRPGRWRALAGRGAGRAGPVRRCTRSATASRCSRGDAAPCVRGGRRDRTRSARWAAAPGRRRTARRSSGSPTTTSARRSPPSSRLRRRGARPVVVTDGVCPAAGGRTRWRTTGRGRRPRSGGAAAGRRHPGARRPRRPADARHAVRHRWRRLGAARWGRRTTGSVIVSPRWPRASALPVAVHRGVGRGRRPARTDGTRACTPARRPRPTSLAAEHALAPQRQRRAMRCGGCWPSA